MASASLRPGGGGQRTNGRFVNNNGNIMTPPTALPKQRAPARITAADRGEASCEGVIHNHFRAFIGAILCRLGNCSMLRVELMAILHGLRIMKNKSILDRVIVESNSLLVLEIINEACNSNHPALLLQWKLLVSSRKVQGTLLEKEMKG
ncbi:hypothetical protein JHK85_028891 [Glycine max]|nr:hypothetical protein JHK85_028891 [Glycine max]